MSPNELVSCGLLLEATERYPEDTDKGGGDSLSISIEPINGLDDAELKVLQQAARAANVENAGCCRLWQIQQEVQAMCDVIQARAQCHICLDPLQSSAVRGDDADKLALLLPCRHIFHKPCLTPWFRQLAEEFYKSDVFAIGVRASKHRCAAAEAALEDAEKALRYHEQQRRVLENKLAVAQEAAAADPAFAGQVKDAQGALRAHAQNGAPFYNKVEACRRSLGDARQTLENTLGSADPTSTFHSRSFWELIHEHGALVCPQCRGCAKRVEDVTSRHPFEPKDYITSVEPTVRGSSIALDAPVLAYLQTWREQTAEVFERQKRNGGLIMAES